MNAKSRLPKPSKFTPVRWRKSPLSREPFVEVQSVPGEVSYQLWDVIQKQRIRTITMPPENVRLERELADILQECSVPDWNGYGAKPVDRESVRLVCKFLEMLPSDVSYPELEAEPNGDLTMTWLKRDYHMGIGIDATGKIAWGGTSPHGRIYGDAKFEEEIPEEVMTILYAIEGNQ